MPAVRLLRRAMLALGMSMVTTAALAAPPARLARAELPAGFVIGTATAPFELALSSVDGAGPDAKLVATPDVQGDFAMLGIESGSKVNLKVDLDLSPDGERFFYTSSCAIPAGLTDFEQWPHAVRAFAIGNPRASGDRMTCH